MREPSDSGKKIAGERKNGDMLLTTFFTFDAGDATAMLGYAGDLLTDLTPLLIPIVGVAVGLIIVMAIIRAIRG